MNDVFTKLLLIIVPAALIMGCLTTGDPSRGGLFGWSERKAKERQAEISREAQAATNRGNTEQLKKQELGSTEAELDDEVSRLEKSIARLMAENEELRDSFADLMGQKVEDDDLLIDLEIELRQTQQSYSNPPITSFSDQDQEKIRLQNQRLNSAILLLLNQR